MDFYLEKTDAVIRSKFVDKIKVCGETYCKKKTSIAKNVTVIMNFLLDVIEKIMFCSGHFNICQYFIL